MFNIAICDRKTSSTWEVFCLSCSKSIGTMTADTLNKAIGANRERGGIMCPECRQASCKECGTELIGDEEIAICWFCKFDEIVKARTKNICEPLV